jgi:hypothetical protein
MTADATRPISNAVLGERLDQQGRLSLETKCAMDNLTQRFGEFINSYGVEHQKVVSGTTAAHQRIDELRIRIERIENAFDGMDKNLDRLNENYKQLVKLLVWIGSGIGVLVLGLLWQIFTGTAQVVIP